MKKKGTSCAGISLIEIVIALSVLTLAGMALIDAMFGSNKLVASSKDNTVAINAAREMLDTIRDYTTFADIFAYYNNNPADDPGGSGTAPGCNFAVSGLKVQTGDTDGFCGKITFPQSGSNLVETYNDPLMGMPRDLNGSGIAPDAASHNNDYIILPVKITIDWQGVGGNRSYSLYSMLTRK